MITKQVVIANFKTLVDGSLRVCIDLLNSNAEDAKELFELKSKDVTMILTETQDLKDLEDNKHDF